MKKKLTELERKTAKYVSITMVRDFITIDRTRQKFSKNIELNNFLNQEHVSAFIEHSPR